MVLAELVAPLRKLRAYLAQHHHTRLQLDAVALAVIKGNGFNAFVALQGVGQAGGRVLATGEEYEGAGMHGPNVKTRRSPITPR